MADGGGRRLLVLCSQGGTGGTQRVAIGVASQMAARGWRTRLVFPAIPEGGDPTANRAVLRLAEDQGVCAEAHPAMLNRVAPRTAESMRRLRTLIRQERPDVVNFHYGWSQVPIRDVIAARTAGVRRVVVSLHLPVPWEQLGGRARRRTQWAAALSSAVVPCSQAVAEVVLQAGVPARKVHVIRGGIRPAEAANRDAPSEVAAARAVLGLPPRAFVVACIARLSPEKAQGDLLRAVAALPPSADGPHLLLQGDGPEREALEALAGQVLPGRVTFLPGDADTHVTYRAADVFALSSHAEGWPLVLMEAAGYGLPVVATAVGGVPDEVHHGRTGLLVPPSHPEAFSAALGTVRDDPAFRAALGAAARERAIHEFTEEAMGDRYEEVLLGRPAPGADDEDARGYAQTALSTGSRSE